MATPGVDPFHYSSVYRWVYVRVNFLRLYEGGGVSDVISVRVRKELKKALEDLGIDYAEEVRRYLEELVARERRRRALERARQLRKTLEREAGVLPAAAELIREDRDADSR